MHLKINYLNDNCCTDNVFQDGTIGDLRLAPGNPHRNLGGQRGRRHDRPSFQPLFVSLPKGPALAAIAGGIDAGKCLNTGLIRRDE